MHINTQILVITLRAFVAPSYAHTRRQTHYAHHRTYDTEEKYTYPIVSMYSGGACRQ